MATSRAPKQWSLQKQETFGSFESWRNNQIYSLNLDHTFAPFMREGVKWTKKSKANPYRGFIDDEDAVMGKKKEDKAATLDLLLGQIANFCPVISRNTITKNCTSINEVWQVIRSHYGFQSNGAHFIDFDSLCLAQDDRPEDLYQKLMAFTEDNLLQADGGISHHNEPITEDEDMTPTLENMVVLTWLRLLHPNLPKIVKQRYGTQLRSQTLATLRNEISQAIEPLLAEARSSDPAGMRSFVSGERRPRSKSYISNPRPQRQKSCPLCKATDRNDRHFLSECKFLPESDRKYMTKARLISQILDSGDSADDSEPESTTSEPRVCRVTTRQSPYVDAFYKHHPVRLTLDSGATGNLIRASTAHSLGLPISKSSQTARQADGSSALTVVGESRVYLEHPQHSLFLEALVVKDLDVEILAGTPFMATNDVIINVGAHEVSIKGHKTFYDGHNKQAKGHQIRLTQILRAPHHQSTIYPGQYLEICTAEDDAEVAIEPRTDSGSSNPDDTSWPTPLITRSVGGIVRIPNLTSVPQTVKRKAHFAQMTATCTPQTSIDVTSHHTSPRKPIKTPNSPFSADVQVDPDNILQKDDKALFNQIVMEFDDVFNPAITGYNGSMGNFEAVVHMGPVQPPQRKGRCPQYSRDKLLELQEKFDQLEDMGVFKKPEDAGVNVEYVNPSFLIKKPSGLYRLVTAFADVGRYSKPQPSLMPDVDSTLRKIGQWRFIIQTDLSNAFYQIPLSKESQRYCGVVTPFRGVRVYVRSAMGMPGSETALEELLCRVLGDELRDGIVTKMADDLFCGGNTIDELTSNWKRVLERLQVAGLCLSAKKTIVCPSKATVLGWTWCDGSLTANSHRIATLSKCALPVSVKDMRSFLGAYKVLARVLPKCSSYLAPLEEMTVGLQSPDKLQWDDAAKEAFMTAQSALTTSQTITLPRTDDELWIITDGAVRVPGVGATLYINRNGKTKIAGFFSAKLRKQQQSWLPCEIEALSVALAVKHYAPYIIAASKQVCLLTDSKQCVQAFEKLCRGEFSASPRVSTFLSVMARYQISLRHIPGEQNLPSDHASRNAVECLEPLCQVCLFVKELSEAVVRKVSTNDIISGIAKLPYTNSSVWVSLQSECKDLRRTHAHLSQGTRPSKKATDAHDVKRYLQAATINRAGLLVVKLVKPLSYTQELVIVPRQVLHGLLMAWHLRLDHPSKHQMKAVVKRHFYALDMDKAIEQCVDRCHQCAALKLIPHDGTAHSTSAPTDTVASTFAADVMRRNRQYILVVRECVTSYTYATLINDERKDTLRDALICILAEVIALDGPKAIVRTDSAAGFAPLVNDDLLTKNRIQIETGRVKNINKNPVGEKAIQEVELEILKQDPSGNQVCSRSLAMALSRLNSRVRSRGLSAREMFFQRDQFTNHQIPVVDTDLISEQHSSRLNSHMLSHKRDPPHPNSSTSSSLQVGDIVYLYGDGNKNHARDRYLIVSVEGEWCNIRKLSGTLLRDSSYRVKRSDCYTVPADIGSLSKPTVSEALTQDFEEASVAESIPAQVHNEKLAYETEPVPKIDHSLNPEATQDIMHPTPAPTVPPTEPDIPPTLISQPQSETSEPTEPSITSSDQGKVTQRQSSRKRTAPSWQKDYVMEQY